MSVQPGTPLPWRVEQDTDLIWGACNPDDTTSDGMGYSIVEGHPAWAAWAKGKPDWEERVANARYISVACNSFPELVAALETAQQALWQYKNDLRYPPASDSIERRCAMAKEASLGVDKALSALEVGNN